MRHANQAVVGSGRHLSVISSCVALVLVLCVCESLMLVVVSAACLCIGRVLPCYCRKDSQSSKATSLLALLYQSCSLQSGLKVNFRASKCVDLTFRSGCHREVLALTMLHARVGGGCSSSCELSPLFTRRHPIQMLATLGRTDSLDGVVRSSVSYASI